MISALPLFTRILAVGLLLWYGYLLGAITLGRRLETPMERLGDKLYGRAWRSRKVPALVVLVAGAWLYSTWGL